MLASNPLFFSEPESLFSEITTLFILSDNVEHINLVDISRPKVTSTLLCPFWFRFNKSPMLSTNITSPVLFIDSFVFGFA